MEKTYIITGSELQALLEKQKKVCRVVAEANWDMYSLGDQVEAAPTPDLSHLKKAEQK